MLQIEEIGHLSEGVGVSASHEAIADETDAKRFFISHFKNDRELHLLKNSEKP